LRQTEFWSRVLGAQDAQDRLVEIPFGQRLGSQLLFGTIDLALRQEDGWDTSSTTKPNASDSNQPGPRLKL